MFGVSHLPQSAISTFELIQTRVTAIQGEASYNIAFGHLKKAVKEINGMADEKTGYYSVKYKKDLPQEFDSDRFWKIMKDKASHPQKYLPGVNSCLLVPEESLETIQHFIRKVNAEIPESIWVNNCFKNILFFYDYKGERRLAAINELKEGKDGKLYYIGRYVAFNLSKKSPLEFKEYMDEVFANMVG